MDQTYVWSKRLNDLNTTCTSADDTNSLSSSLVAHWPPRCVRSHSFKRIQALVFRSIWLVCEPLSNPQLIKERTVLCYSHRAGDKIASGSLVNTVLPFGCDVPKVQPVVPVGALDGCIKATILAEVHLVADECKVAVICSAQPRRTTNDDIPLQFLPSREFLCP